MQGRFAVAACLAALKDFESTRTQPTTKQTGMARSRCLSYYRGESRRLHDMASQLTLRIVIEQPPLGVDFALQKGRGKLYETTQKQRSDGNDVVFEFQPLIREGPSTIAAFGGPFVQGPPRQQFVYVDIGTYAGQADSCWSRRMKIPLDGIPSKFIAKGGVLEARVPGTARDGGPTCATVKDFSGWKAPH
jgi:hypothetical protein